MPPIHNPKNPDEPALQASSLTKRSNGRCVVNNVDLRCQAGQVLGLLGANGAGKTTTLRLCYGFLQPDTGTIHIGLQPSCHEGQQR